ncbi:hypothetical protein TrCOL_g4419 [Triparma columacea]|uniref:Valine--tRNA ligase, mitochondrial n=1 Tax=Triparma columacea TaxID=722753 RepID=A0A9W7L6F1_9STRA|nr:hypothetical protein TrCOL_g4419 [Triparma columacea]
MEKQLQLDEKIVAMSLYDPDAPPPAPLQVETKMSKSAMKKAAKEKLNPKKDKKDKAALKAAWGAGGKKKEAKVVKKIDFVNTTPPGEKKDMSAPMLDAYHPQAVEAAWGSWWEKRGFFGCDPAFGKGKDPKKDKFVMVIPPPNVTGSLHLGHALTAAVEDTLTRWHRMSGHATMYVPGTDHAGIATQSVVEKQLMKNDGITRHEVGRENFVKKVWEWKEEYGTKITKQLRFLGTSVDWSRERFTMDEKCSKAVIEAFNRFKESGILYRDTRLGNWSCALKSAISDIEVDTLELEGRTFLNVPNHKGNPKDKNGKYEFGVITSFFYEVEGTGEKVEIATTRLETMLGDTAVAIHPEDKRYKHLHGKHVIHPFSGRRIPFILDSILVDMEKGTGVVKVTPAHDPKDYQTGKRHNLEFLTMLNEDGSINEMGGEQFAGMMRYDARIAIEDALKEKGLLGEKKPNKMNIGTCSRSGDILEPRITPQWYVNCKGMAARACEAVRDGSLKIVPKEHEKTWFHWLENIQDWCISRQLWWGHRIPAWFATKKGESGVDKNSMANNDRWIVARNEEEALEKAAKFLNCPASEVVLDREDDVLDTWFSSGLFPFSVFGWPDNTEDLEAFYPTSLLETGLDIIFFWVARMVMMGLQLTDKLPFHTVYLHAMVRDKNGRKMSKSLGNVIDPLEVIRGCTLESLYGKLENGNLPKKEVERAKKDQKADFPDGIPECGSDALRFGLLAYTVQGRDVNLDIKRVVGYRQFCNKLWNATKFAIQFLDDFKPVQQLGKVAMESGKMSPADYWMMSRLNTRVANMNTLLSKYEFGMSQQNGYNFWLEEISRTYMEAIKPVVYDKSDENKDARWAAQATLWLSLECGLKLLHPMMPFVTEELWQRLPGRGTLGKDEPETIMLAPYPEEVAGWTNKEIEDDMETVTAIVGGMSKLRDTYSIAAKDRPEFYVKTTSERVKKVCGTQKRDIETLGKGKIIVDKVASKSCAVNVVDDGLTLYMDLKGMVDFGKELKKLEKQKKKIEYEVTMIENKMNDENYDRASDKVKVRNAEDLAKNRAKLDEIMTAMKNFEELAKA